MKNTVLRVSFLFIFIFFIFPCSARTLKLEGSFLCETAPVRMRLAEIPQTVDVFIKMVESASQEIDIGALYLTQSADRALMSALRSALKRGVKIRMVLNDSEYSRKQIYKTGLDLEPGLDLRFFAIAPYGHKPYGIYHAKYVIVDGKMALLGSANFSYPALHDNREVNIFTTDPGVLSSLKSIFELDSSIAALQEPATNRSFFKGGIRAVDFSTNAGQTLCETAPVQFDDPSIPDFRDALQSVVSMARSNIRGSIYLYTLAYTNEPFLENAFFKAMGKGVALDLAVNHGTYWEREKKSNFEGEEDRERKSEWKYPDYRTAVDRAAARGAHIRFINPKKFVDDKKFATSHSKYLIIDGHFLVLGSANWTASSVSENRETCLFTKDPALLRQAQLIFDRDWKFSEGIASKSQAK
jgi:phosphatidylserine/phosphatidylglycerophosphate/cardiolipin synthase-like enzyme